MSVPQTYRYVDELIKRGDLEKNGRYGDLQTKEIVNSLCSHNRLPIVGEVACGTPILAEENIEWFNYSDRINPDAPDYDRRDFSLPKNYSISVTSRFIVAMKKISLK